MEEELIKRKAKEISVWLDGKLVTNVESAYKEMDIKIVIKPKQAREPWRKTGETAP